MFLLFNFQIVSSEIKIIIKDHEVKMIDEYRDNIKLLKYNEKGQRKTRILICKI